MLVPSNTFISCFFQASILLSQESLRRFSWCTRVSAKARQSCPQERNKTPYCTPNNVGGESTSGLRKASTPPTPRGASRDSMPFVLFLALLASATAAPTTKDRRANEFPKVRLVVTGETNVARTTRGARASNRVTPEWVAQMGGNVTMTIRAAHNTFTVVEVADPNEARLFKEQAERSGLRVEEDQRRYPGPSSATRTQPLAEETPWGIKRVDNGAVPNASCFPSAVTHPLCIIDSGYLLTHPDLPSDATAADPSQAIPAGTMYFGGDLCRHGTHVLILSAAPLRRHHSLPAVSPPPPFSPHPSSITPPHPLPRPPPRPPSHQARMSRAPSRPSVATGREWSVSSRVRLA